MQDHSCIILLMTAPAAGRALSRHSVIRQTLFSILARFSFSFYPTFTTLRLLMDLCHSVFRIASGAASVPFPGSTKAGVETALSS